MRLAAFNLPTPTRVLLQWGFVCLRELTQQRSDRVQVAGAGAAFDGQPPNPSNSILNGPCFRAELISRTSVEFYVAYL